MNNQKKINIIKARLLLGETVDDQEMFSYAINALNESDINYKWFLKALKKPIKTKQYSFVRTVSGDFKQL